MSNRIWIALLILVGFHFSAAAQQSVLGPNATASDYFDYVQKKTTDISSATIVYTKIVRRTEKNTDGEITNAEPDEIEQVLGQWKGDKFFEQTKTLSESDIAFGQDTRTKILTDKVYLVLESGGSALPELTIHPVETKDPRKTKKPYHLGFVATFFPFYPKTNPPGWRPSSVEIHTDPDGRELIDLLYGNEKRKRWMRQTLDPNSGFLPMITKSGTIYRQTESESAFNVLEVEEIIPGYFFPMHKKGFTKMTYSSGIHETEVEYIVSNVELNADIPDGVFEILEAPGMQVHNLITGEQYTAGE